jgi:hypothetical protein
MSRAEMRRMQREKKKAKTVTYNLTKEQLDAMVEERISTRIREAKEAATYDAVNTAMTLMLVLPMEVLMDHYWQKSYATKIPEFTNYVLKYYERWMKGELDMDEMKKDLWEYGGVRLEESEDRVI